MRSRRWSRSWQCATDHGEIAKVIQLVHCVAEQIVAVCHKSWGNREGDTARALRRRADCGFFVVPQILVESMKVIQLVHASPSRSWCFSATDHGEIVKAIQLARCGADRGIVPQIMEEFVKVIQLSRWRCRRCSSVLLWTSL